MIIIIIIVIISLESFHTSIYRSVSDSKSPQVSRTLLSILADHSNTVICIVLASPIFSSSNPLPSLWEPF